jgi:PAS domain-containing protein
MAHIELSLTSADAAPDEMPSLRVVGRSRELDAWLAAVADAEEPCMVLDAGGIIAGVSGACVRLLGAATAEEVVGRGLLEDVVELLDFTNGSDRLAETQLPRLAPLLALASGAPARGLLRIRTADGVATFDAVATPLRVDGDVAGSLTFFHRL